MSYVPTLRIPWWCFSLPRQLSSNFLVKKNGFLRLQHTPVRIAKISRSGNLYILNECVYVCILYVYNTYVSM